MKGRSALFELARLLSETADAQSLLAPLAAAAVELTGAGASAVFEVTEAGEASLVAHHDLPAAATDLREEADAIGPELAQHVLSAAGAEFTSARAIPMVSGGDMFGALVLLFRARDTLTKDGEEVARGLVSLAATAMDKAAKHAHILRTHDELRASQDTLLRTEKLRALGEMAAGISHDLKNVVAPLSLHLQVARRAVAKKQDGDATVAIQECEAIVRRASELLERLRDFSRQAPESRLEDVDLDRLAQEAAVIAKPRMASRPGRLNPIEFALGKPPAVPARSSEVLSALVNLVVNAIDAMPDGGTITLKSGLKDGQAYVAVSDEGPGMSAEVRAKVFQPFFTTKGEKGTGLGLAMVYACMQRHGGSVNVDSTLGRGTTFTLWFPIPSSG
ncbi:MAG TPA: HAMP domain-containing sensor histidine kinase [Polyangiaceae bacterium]|jgi:signal transduction histidine kinase